MSEFIRDYVRERWVILAPRRGDRPLQFSESLKYRPKGSPDSCPFCPGNEHQTPPEVFVIPNQGGNSSWKIRVVPNKYPIVEGKEGVHWVIIETPDHYATVGKMPQQQVFLILKTYRDRLLALKERFPYAMVFKNRGPEGGASLSHPHSQLIALQLIPDAVQREMKVYERGCPICLLLEREGAGDNLLFSSENFTVLCPSFSAFPFETWIVPKKHLPSFEESSDETLEELAWVYKRTMAALDRAVDFPSFNMVLRSRPFSSDSDYHWRMEIVPRLTKPAGFEWGAEVPVNIVAPERAAEILRRHLE